MGKIGIIASIPLAEVGTRYESSLAKAGMSRSPGTGQLFLPHKERNNEYRTGLDPDAAYIKSIADPLAREYEKKKVAAERERLEDALKVSLDCRSDFFNISTWSPTGRNKLVVTPVKLMDGNNYFDLQDPMAAVSFAWLRVNPRIASSIEAYYRGDYPDAKFYVKDDELEQEIQYRKTEALHDAIHTLKSVLSLEKRKKIARQCGIGVTEDDKEVLVYNKLNTFINEGVLKSGPFEGSYSVDVFMRFVDMDEEVLYVRDLVKQAVTHSIYRQDRMGRLFEGQATVAKSEHELIEFLLDKENQEAISMLEDKIKAKKSLTV